MTYCIMWDFDNTLAYRNGMWTKSLCNVLDYAGYLGTYDEAVIKNEMRTGLPWHYPEKAHFEYFKGLDWWGYVTRRIAQIIIKSGIAKDKANELAFGFRAEYLKEKEWFLFDETTSALDESISRGYDNLIVSNHTPELGRLVCYLGIEKYFKAVITSAIVGYEKPHPRIFEHAKSICPADRYMMIGDNYHADVTGALSCGIDAVLVRKENITGYEKYSMDLSGIWCFIDPFA